MILITREMEEKEFQKFNEKLVAFGLKRGMWCKGGVMMKAVDQENLDKVLKLMEQDHIGLILVDSQDDFFGIDVKQVNECFKKQEISCLCMQENIILGKEDDRLLRFHDRNAALVYEDESEIEMMKEYAAQNGFNIRSVTQQTLLNEEEQKALRDQILLEDIDAVIMPTTDYFNGEDYTTPLAIDLYNHGIEVVIAKDGVNISRAIHAAFQKDDLREMLEEVMSYGQ